jgi:hypothetical protein
MLYLADHYGTSFMTALHREDASGLVGLQNVLDAFLTGKKASDVIHQWAATVALDQASDQGGKLRGNQRQRQDDYQVDALNASILWATPEAYSTPGAPPNGSDYVQLRDAAGNPLAGKDVRSIRFKGSTNFAALPTQWTIDGNPPLHAGDAAYFGGRTDNLDNAMAREVTVPAATPSLAFDILWSTEVGFDSVFVQVSEDGGKTWHSLSNPDMTTSLPNANGLLQSNLPGFNGESHTWKHETIDMAAYAGKTVLLSFRYITDENTRGEEFDGVWVDNITLGGAAVGNGTLAGWRSLTEINPVKVNGFTVQVVAIQDANLPAPKPGEGPKPKPSIVTIPLDASFAGVLDGSKLRSAIPPKAEIVGAIVTYDEPTESIPDYARYQLWANDVLQPGG